MFRYYVSLLVIGSKTCVRGVCAASLEFPWAKKPRCLIHARLLLEQTWSNIIQSVSTRVPSSSSSTHHCCSLTIHYRVKGLNHIFWLFLLSVLKPTSSLPLALNPSLDQHRRSWRATLQRNRKKKWAEMALSAIYWYFASRKTRLKISHTTSKWELTSSRAMG